ncbi:MAG: hypothetical protein OXC69_10665 [Candidatus Tectomicrobia bacterium]|nr:hypothetical protein [Candidatus Tectomicrobia bacterium]
MTRGTQARGPSSRFEKKTAYMTALAVVGASLYLIVRNEPFEDPNLVVLARTILSFAMAVLGATIPGFLSIAWTGGGLAIRAGGALALFVLTFFVTPTVLPIEFPTSDAAHTDLKIADVSAQRDTVDIKLKNSGNDSAFITEVRFIQRFAYAGCCSCAYLLVVPTTYEYPLTFGVRDEMATSRLPVHSLHEREPAPESVLTSRTSASKEARCGPSPAKGTDTPTEMTFEKTPGTNDNIFDLCVAHYRDYGGKAEEREVETRGIKLSQGVPPRGLDSFQLSFSTPRQQELRPDEYLVLEGYAVIFFDSEAYICTPDFKLVLSGLKES